MAPKGKKSRKQRRTENKAQLALTYGSAGSAAPPGPPPATRKVDGRRGKGGKGEKGEGKGGKVPLPASVKRHRRQRASTSVSLSTRRAVRPGTLHLRAHLLVVRRQKPRLQLPVVMVHFIELRDDTISFLAGRAR